MAQYADFQRIQQDAVFQHIAYQGYPELPRADSDAMQAGLVSSVVWEAEPAETGFVPIAVDVTLSESFVEELAAFKAELNDVIQEYGELLTQAWAQKIAAAEGYLEPRKGLLDPGPITGMEMVELLFLGKMAGLANMDGRLLDNVANGYSEERLRNTMDNIRARFYPKDDSKEVLEQLFAIFIRKIKSGTLYPK